MWGEDALLRWPGALTPLIDERDDFMARVLAAAATGTNPNVPAYVADEVRCCWMSGTGMIWQSLSDFLNLNCLIFCKQQRALSSFLVLLCLSVSLGMGPAMQT